MGSAQTVYHLIAGWGAPSMFGGGVQNNGGTAAGLAGTSYGAGGSGGYVFNAASSIAGGPSFGGIVIITEYII